MVNVFYMQKVIFLCGFMGSGKTTVGQLLAERLHCAFVDLDLEIEKTAGKTIAEIFAANGEDYFRTLESEVLKNTVQKSENTNAVVALGGGTPCFPQNVETIKAAGTSFYLQWTNEDLLMRLKIDDIEKRPLLRGKTDEELLTFISKSISCREKFYRQANFTLSAKTDEALAQAIAEKIKITTPKE
jgi:shikimate kinase